MRKYGYDDALSTGVVSVGGTLGIMIPPSTTFIVYGIMTEQSIGRLFAAGIIPGIVTALLFMTTVVVIVKLKPGSAPKTTEGFTWGERIQSLKGLFWIIILFGVVFGGLFSGLTTVNESAALGAFCALVIMIVRRKFTGRSILKVMKDSIKTTAMVYLILIGAEMFGKFLAITRLPMTLADMIREMNVSPYVVMFIIIVIYAVMGCFMDALPMITLTIPIFIPIILELGFDPIWFGVVCVLVVQLGLITPPVGLNCYVIAGIAKDVPLSKIFRGSAPFIPALLVSILLVILFPEVVLWLPNLIYN
jgi:tripartite ATP-independent transporter DctM subunit